MEWELELPFDEPEPVVEEPSVLEYAREQGICVDYTTELPRLRDIVRERRDTLDRDPWGSSEDANTDTMSTANTMGTANIASAANAATTAAQKLMKERLALNKEAALLLKTVLTLREPPRDDSLIADARQTRDLKQELPVLQTDAELDLLHFGTRVEPDFRDLGARLPSEDLDDENDEGFGWSVKYAVSPKQGDAKVKSEKLAVTRDALAFLHNAVKDDYSAQDEDDIVVAEMERKVHLAPRHLTPPLLPLSPPLTPYIRSSPANQLSLIPECSDTVTADARALEQQIMARDSLIRHHSGSSDSMLLDDVDVDDIHALLDAQDQQATSPHFSKRIPSILQSKRKADELRVEGPLTPEILSDSPMEKLKSVTFSNMIQVGGSLQPWSGDSPSSESHSASEELTREIEQIAKEADRKVENEKLTGADTMSRVPIPLIDFTLPVTPWDEFSKRRDEKRLPYITELEAQMRFLQLVKRDDLKSATAWRGGAPDRDLSWGWFASPCSTIRLNEKVHGETEFEKVQVELKIGSVATSANEVWKKDGLRVLDEEEDEDDDELEVAEFEERNDVEALIRKRKLELQEHEDLLEEQRKRRQASAASAAVRKERYGVPHQQTLPAQPQDLRRARKTPPASRLQQPIALQPQSRQGEKNGNAPTELMFSGFSASTALHKFMETQGKAIKAANSTAEAQRAVTPPAQTVSALNSVLSAEFIPPVEQEPGALPTHLAQRRRETSLPFNLPPSSFIVSSSLLQRRPFLKQIEPLHPKADLIYRDYNLPHSTAAEADIILSPSTGILLTTLQQIKQAPLPGQAAGSPVKERIAALQERYERLVVLVSEGLRGDSEFARPEDTRDKDTLRDLEVFAAMLEGEVLVTFVRGGEQTLARGVVERMAEYGLPHGGEDIGDIRLFSMETTWEVFLRRAGINPFAAQVILASLKVPTIITLPDLGAYHRNPGEITPRDPCAFQKTVEAAGLPAFLLMEREDRAKQFQAIMGGRRILGKVSAVLDQKWLIASDGYRM